jgi:hypothetical protein
MFLMRDLRQGSPTEKTGPEDVVTAPAVDEGVDTSPTDGGVPNGKVPIEKSSELTQLARCLRNLCTAGISRPSHRHPLLLILTPSRR